MRVRSPACKHIISFYSKVDHCQVCIEKCKRAKKRETSASVSERTCTKPKVGKFEATSSNTPLRNLTNMCTSNGPATSADSPTDPLLNNTKDDTIDKLLSSGAPEKFKLFLEMQLQNSKTDLDKRQRKWDPDFISFCLSIDVLSPRIYRDLRDSPMLVLPSESLLRMYKNCIKQKPDINEENLTWMKKEAERQNVSDFGKRGGLIVDEMSIQDELQIVRKGDAWSIVDGVDMGQTNNIISTITHNQKKTELATHCLQFLFHGFCGFRWPAAYYGSSLATTHQLLINFWDCVDVLDEYGFKVDYIMLDGASTNRSLMNMLLHQDPRYYAFTATDAFNKEHKIYVIQDIKHVIKKIRNKFEASKLQKEICSRALFGPKWKANSLGSC